MDPNRRASWLVRPDVGHRDWVDFAKGLAIVLVAYFHAVLMLRTVEVDSGGGRLKVLLEMFPMPTFFIIAGLFSARLLTWTLSEAWRRRILLYLYLYALWSVIRFVFYWIVPGASGEVGEISAQNPLGLAAILVWPSSSYWFIYALAIFTFVTWAIRRLPVWVQITSAAVISSLFSSGLINTTNVGWNRIGAYLVFFVAGVHFSKWIVRAAPKARWWHVVAFGAGALAVVALLLLLRGTHIPGLALIGQVCAVGLGIAVSVQLVRVRPLAFVSHLGANSYQIYLIHLFVIAASVVLVSLVAGDHTPRIVALLLSVTVAAVAIYLSLVIARLTRRFSWLYVLPRRRSRRPRSTSGAPDPSPAASETRAAP
ncbi:acyltransferase-like protein [Diaminobutyricimonas aerilata]|uniref:Acyltransferase-like protein n=1 Tax=Diaminobutyricimonas aerilata TaxID=1162967 RepID=A0A2M9CIY2_9MICO|nr:acyltransferase [Diaminobutyricimonas aerilata]PJJ71849.1 acyltransferase-like protein [Diaminobutyricimonas aerilata]